MRWRMNKTRVTNRVLMAAALTATLVAPTAASTAEPPDGEQRPVLYLTFDDGPSLDSATPSLLALLAEHDVTATFFVVGQNVDKSPESVEGIVDGGHALGNHTQDHVRLTELSDADVRRQLEATQQAVDRAGGPTMSCYRPPFGATDTRVLDIAASLGLSEEMWSLDPFDYERLDPQRYTDVLHGAGDGEVVLLHDGFVDGEVTVEAVRRFLDDRRDDFDFRAMPGCVGPSTGEPLTPPTTVEPAVTTTVPPEPLPDPVCRLGPLDASIDANDPHHGMVFRLYCSHLGRHPDDAGFGYWVEVVAAEQSARALADWFIASDEFDTRFGGSTDEAFVTQVYDNVLGRPADELGRTYWLEVLAEGAGRAEVTFAFSESAEFRASTGTS